MDAFTYTDIYARRFIVYLVPNVNGGTYILNRPCDTNTASNNAFTDHNGDSVEQPRADHRGLGRTNTA